MAQPMIVWILPLVLRHSTVSTVCWALPPCLGEWTAHRSAEECIGCLPHAVGRSWGFICAIPQGSESQRQTLQSRASGLRVEESFAFIEFAFHGRASLAHEHFPHKATTTSKTPTLLLCHGIMSESKDLAACFGEFIGQRIAHWQMILPDFLGHGQDLARVQREGTQFQSPAPRKQEETLSCNFWMHWKLLSGSG